MTPNYTCMRCGHTMFGLAEVEAHKCDPSVTTAETRAQIINGKFARRAAEASETPISRDELRSAIRRVRMRFAGNGTEVMDAIADVLHALYTEIE